MARLLTVKEFHELARIAVSTIYHLADKKKVPQVLIGARTLFILVDIDSCLKANSAQVVGPSHMAKTKKEAHHGTDK